MHEGSIAAEVADPDYGDLRATARRALDFERPYLRRRWAAYYAVWATAAAAYFLVPFLLGFTRFATIPSDVQLLIFAGMDIVVSLAAVTVSVLIWGLAERTFALRSAVDGRTSFASSRNLIRFAIVVVITVAAVLISTRSDLATYLLVDTVLLVLSLLLLVHLHRAFRPVPPEGWLSSAAFIAAAAGSYASLALFDYPRGHEIAWSAAVLVWLACAAYARFGVRDTTGVP